MNIMPRFPGVVFNIETLPFDQVTKFIRKKEPSPGLPWLPWKALASPECFFLGKKI